MILAEAKEYVGLVCNIAYKDRSGKLHNIVSKIYDATYVPLYGGYLVTDTDDIRFDRICAVTLVSEGAATAASSSATIAEQLAA